MKNLNKYDLENVAGGLFIGRPKSDGQYVGQIVRIAFDSEGAYNPWGPSRYETSYAYYEWNGKEWILLRTESESFDN